MVDEELSDGAGVTVEEIESYSEADPNTLVTQLEEEGYLSEGFAYAGGYDKLRLGELTSGVYYRGRVQAAADARSEMLQVLKEVFAVDYDGPRVALTGGQSWTQATDVAETGVVAPAEMAEDVREELSETGEPSTPVTDAPGINVPDAVIEDARSPDSQDSASSDTTSDATTTAPTSDSDPTTTAPTSDSDSTTTAPTTTAPTTDSDATSDSSALSAVGRRGLAVAGVAVLALAVYQQTR